MKTLQVQIYIKQRFHDEQDALYRFNVFCVIRNDIGHVFICWWVALLVSVS